MIRKEIEGEDDWAEVGSDDDAIVFEGGDEEPVPPPASTVGTTGAIATSDECEAAENAAAETIRNQNQAEESTVTGITSGTPDTPIEEEARSLGVQNVAAASERGGDPIPDAKFYEGDKAMFVSPQDRGTAASISVTSNAVKVRVISVDPPYYRIALPDGTETDVHITNSDNGRLFTVDEYEALAQEREAVRQWNFVPTECFGGSGGVEFDDFPNRWRKIDEISINTGALVDGIRLLYSDGSVSEYGMKGGGWASFALAGGEYINETEIKYGRFVQSLTFWTNKGRQLGPCGAGGFFLGMGRVTTTRLKAPPRHLLAGIHGRNGKYIDAVGMHWAPVTAAAEKVTKQDLSTQLKKKLLKSTECFGGLGGGPFDDGHYNIRINEINVRAGRKGTVKGITVWYFNGKVASYGKKQNDDDHGEYLSLELGEYINEVHVRFGQYVEGLTFKTTRGRELICGANGTDENCTEVAMTKAPEGYMLVGIKGGSGARLDRIGFNWSPIPSDN